MVSAQDPGVEEDSNADINDDGRRRAQRQHRRSEERIIAEPEGRFTDTVTKLKSPERTDIWRRQPRQTPEAKRPILTRPGPNQRSTPNIAAVSTIMESPTSLAKY